MRIQILPLPAVMVGDDLEEPFAMVFDQIDGDVNKELLYEFARQCGSKTHVMLPQTVEIVDRYAEPDTSEIDKLADYLLKHFGDEIGEGSAVDNAIRLLGGILLRRDAVRLRDEIRFVQAARQEKPGGEERRRAESDRVETDRLRLEIDRLRAIVSRVVEIPREPVTLPYIGAEAYTRGWQDVRALVDKALLPEEGQG